MSITKTPRENQYSDLHRNFQAIACACTLAIVKAQQLGNENEAHQLYVGKHQLIKLMKLFRNRDAN